MPKYRVKEGVRHGAQGQYGPGDIVELTEFEAGPFLFKLERVPDKPAPEAAETPADAREPAPEAGPGPRGFPLPVPEAADSGKIPPDLDELTVDETLALVDGGQLDAAVALGAERAGKGRVSLIRELERRLGD